MKRKISVKAVLRAALCAVLFCVAAFLSCPALAGHPRHKRDPFVPLVGVTAERAHGGILTIMSISDVSFEGIVSDPLGKRSLILNGEIIEEGQTIGIVTVKKVGTVNAEILIGEKKFEIELYEQF